MFCLVNCAQRRAPSEFIVMLTAGLLYWSNSSFASVTTSPSNGALPLRSVDLIAYNSNVCPFLSNSEGCRIALLHGNEGLLLSYFYFALCFMGLMNLFFSQGSRPSRYSGEKNRKRSAGVRACLLRSVFCRCNWDRGTAAFRVPYLHVLFPVCRWISKICIFCPVPVPKGRSPCRSG